MILLAVHITPTPMAGAPHRFVDLINFYTKHNAVLIIERDFVFSFGCKQKVNRERKHEVPDIIKSADVLHFHGSQSFDRRKVLGHRLDDAMREKRVILHYHGTPQRERFRRYQRNGVKLLVSTPEMIRLFPGCKYFPNLIDEQDNEMYPHKRTYNTPPRFCHHFSLHVRRKNTDTFMALKRRYRENIFDVIPEKSHIECNRARLNYDVCFDHLQGYYGIISLEAMAQGLAVINGAAKYVMDAIYGFVGVKPPFIVTNQKMVIPRINDLINNNGMAQEIGERGRWYMQNHWSGKQLINRLISVYSEL